MKKKALWKNSAGITYLVLVEKIGINFGMYIHTTRGRRWMRGWTVNDNRLWMRGSRKLLGFLMSPRFGFLCCVFRLFAWTRRQAFEHLKGKRWCMGRKEKKNQRRSVIYRFRAICAHLFGQRKRWRARVQSLALRSVYNCTRTNS